MDPPQPPTDPGAGLVDTHHPGGAERLTGTLDERFQVGRGLGDDGGDAARRHLHPNRLVQDLGAALDRHEMRRGEVRDQRAHPRPVTGRRGRLTRKPCRRHRVTQPATTPQHPMLDHPHHRLGDVEDLPRALRDDLRLVQIGAAARAAVRAVPDHLVRLGGLRQTRPARARLLPWPAPLPARTPLLPVRRRLGATLRGRRPRRVPRGLPQPGLELGDPRLQLLDHPVPFGQQREQLTLARRHLTAGAHHHHTIQPPDRGKTTAASRQLHPCHQVKHPAQDLNSYRGPSGDAPTRAVPVRYRSSTKQSASSTRCISSRVRKSAGSVSRFRSAGVD